MSDFGDFEPDDAVSTEPPDPEALARYWVKRARALTGDPKRPATFDDLHPFERALLLYLFADIVAKLVREWQQKAPG